MTTPSAQSSLAAEAHGACARLRFAEGLRRGSEEARAEAAVQEAVLLAWIEGARGSAAELREMTMQMRNARLDVPELDPGAAQMLGIWRAAWQVGSELPPLNARASATANPRPLPSVLATLNRNVCSFLVASGGLPSGLVGLPRKPQVVQEVLKLAANSNDSAIDNAAQIFRLMLSEAPFAAGNTSTAFLFVKWVLAVRGVEPTAVALISQYASTRPAELSQLVAGGAQSEWTEFVEQCLIEGCAAGQVVATSIQAQRVVHRDTQEQ